MIDYLTCIDRAYHEIIVFHRITITWYSALKITGTLIVK